MPFTPPEGSSLLTRRTTAATMRLGYTVMFRGNTLWVSDRPGNQTEVGSNKLPSKSLGPYVASYDPKVWWIDPQLFVPHTAEPVPIESEVIEAGGYFYVITAVKFLNHANDTVRIEVTAYRDIVS